MSLHEVRSSEDPLAGLPARRATLNGRRRLLEHVLRLVPAVATMLILCTGLAILGLPLATLSLVAFTVATLALLPYLISRFERRRAEVIDRADAVAMEKGLAPHERAESRIRETAQRARIIVDRPLERLKISWMAVPVLIGGVVLTSAAIISGLIGETTGGRHPTLMIVLLVVCARVAVTISQQVQEAAFFASAVAQLDAGESGIEVL